MATIDELFPEMGRLLLTGGGKEFIERIGVEAARSAVYSVLTGANIRTQTEPLTRRRIAQVSGAMLVLFAQGNHGREDFFAQLSQLAVEQINASRKSDSAAVWPAQWLIGLTGKSVQNVLRSNPEARDAYIADFDAAIRDAAAHCRKELGDLEMTLGFAETPDGARKPLSWEDMTRITTAIGSLTLTLRGSDKSIYGKLFERLVLGSALTILGFERVNPATNTRTEGVFWLSDSSDTRESDATLILKPGTVARFDIGFIGPGNSEISKDKLTRYGSEMELGGAAYNSNTFIVVDRLPDTSKTRKAADRIGAVIVEMSMQCLPQVLARHLESRFGYRHALATMPDEDVPVYIESKLSIIPIQNFLTGVRVEDLGNEA